MNPFITRLLDPITPETFLSEYFEKKPLHIPRADGEIYREWCDLDSFLRVLSDVDPSRLRFRAADKGVASRPDSLQKAVDLLDRGATIVVETLELFHRDVGALCRHLEAFFYHPFQANAYFTPRSNQGFGVHFDIHDVFVLQIYGTKTWKVYKRESDLPLEKHLHPVDPAAPRQPVINTVLEPGHLLYMPRGFTHEGAANDDCASLHLSLGLLHFTWTDLFKMALDQITDQDSALRATVPLGPYDRAARDPAAALEKALAAFSGLLRSECLNTAEETFVFQRPRLNPEFPLGERHNPITLESTLRRNPLAMFHVRRKPRHIELIIHGQALRFPNACEPLLEHMLGQEGEFTVASLPEDMLDESTRIRLAATLHKEGLLLRV